MVWTSDQYCPIKSLREEVERFKATNQFSPVLVTNFYAQAACVLTYVAELEEELKRMIARATAEIAVDENAKVFHPSRPTADFTITIKSKRGERLQVSAWRFNGRVLLSDGVKSVRQFCRGLELLITKSA